MAGEKLIHGFMIGRWQSHEAEPWGDLCIGWIPLEREPEASSGFDSFQCVYPAFMRFVTEGEATEVLDICHYSLPIDEVVERVRWWQDQIKEREEYNGSVQP